MARMQMAFESQVLMGVGPELLRHLLHLVILPCLAACTSTQMPHILVVKGLKQMSIPEVGNVTGMKSPARLIVAWRTTRFVAFDPRAPSNELGNMILESIIRSDSYVP